MRQLPDAAEAAVTGLAPHAPALIHAFAVADEVLLDHPINHPEAMGGDQLEDGSGRDTAGRN